MPSPTTWVGRLKSGRVGKDPTLLQRGRAMRFDYQHLIDIPLPSPNPNGYPLHHAVRERDVVRVRELIKAGADLQGRDVRGLTPLDALAYELPLPGDTAIAEALLEALGPRWWHSIDHTVELAVLHRNAALLEVIVRLGYPLRSRRREGRRTTPLHLAAKIGDAVVLGLLADSEFIQKGDEVGARALHYARSKDAVDVLVAAGADVDCVNDDGDRPLHLAKTPDVVEALIRHGADVNARNKSGQSPLHRLRHRKAVKAILKAGADVNVYDRFGITPLMESVAYAEVALCLLAAGADVAPRDRRGRTALMRSAERGVPRLVRAILEAGADPTPQDRYGEDFAAIVMRRSRGLEVVGYLAKHAPRQFARLIPSLVAVGGYHLPRYIDRLQSVEQAGMTREEVAGLLMSDDPLVRTSTILLLGRSTAAPLPGAICSCDTDVT